MKKIKSVIDTNKDGIVSPEEEQKALETLVRAEKNRKKDMQNKFQSYLTNINMNTHIDN
jgi:polyhydroxyalkanoate synthesis regulator phasin